MGIFVPHLPVYTEKNSPCVRGMIIQAGMGKMAAGGLQNSVCQHHKLFSLNVEEPTG